MATTVLCPYCFEQSGQKELLARCPQDCGDDATEFLPDGKGLCPHGREPQRGRLCPKCKEQLEYDYVTTPRRTIALIGPADAGKSTYVGVLVNELRNRVGPAFAGMSVEFVGDPSRQRYKEVFAIPMYEKGDLVDKTQRLRTKHKLEPLLFTLKFPGTRRFFGDARLTAAMMIFFDTSGEDVALADSMDLLARYLDSADGIIVMIDPLQIPSVRDRVSTTASPKPKPEQLPVLIRLAELLRERRQQPATRLISTPLAITLSKTDALASAIPEQSPLRRSGFHNGYYDANDGQLIHEEVRSWLQRWYGEEFINTVANNFSMYRYFGMSSLGAAPVNGNKISASGIHPLRVEDPLLWLLGQFGIVKVRKAKQ
jgi:hypothetical protein